MGQIITREGLAGKNLCDVYGSGRPASSFGAARTARPQMRGLCRVAYAEALGADAAHHERQFVERVRAMA
jgi:hypothetical protein